MFIGVQVIQNNPPIFSKLFMRIILFILGFSLSYCQTPAVVDSKEFNLSEEVNKRTVPYDSTKTIPIHFASNRKLNNSEPGCSNSYFSNQYDANTRYGTCEVNVPALHDIGELDYDLKKSNDQTFKFLSYNNMDSNDFLKQVKNDPFPEVILFVHGFNVKFEEAVLRAAQIKYDLKFPGQVILFTWPAGSEDGILNNIRISQTYKNNQENAERTIPVLKAYVNSLLGANKKIHLIVHSMGHQIVLPAIHELYVNRNKKLFSEIVLNAPDFESVKFAQISRDLLKASDRVTVYCSPGDNALVASSKVNSNQRVGSCELITGIDMINVNPIDAPFLGVGGLGHGYYSSRAVLTDLYQVILGVKAQRRLFIRKSTQRNENYVLRR
jgi:esterase/lipase superfamily enzyme